MWTPLSLHQHRSHRNAPSTGLSGRLLLLVQYNDHLNVKLKSHDWLLRRLKRHRLPRIPALSSRQVLPSWHCVIESSTAWLPEKLFLSPRHSRPAYTQGWLRLHDASSKQMGLNQSSRKVHRGHRTNHGQLQTVEWNEALQRFAEQVQS